MRFVIFGAIPVGALLGGYLGETIGLRAALLVGAAGGLLAPLVIEERLGRYRWLQAAFYLALLLLIGSPFCGANLGGALAAAAGFSAALAFALWPGRWLRSGIIAGAALLITAIGLFAWDAAQPPASRTHIGDFARTVAAGGWAAAVPVLQGKAAMGLRILGSDYALVPILGVAPLLGLWYHGAGRWLRALLTRRPELRAAIIGSVVGGVAALLLNDSGVVPWLFITGAVLALLLDEQLQGEP
jgi:hypothetical protein